MDQVAEQLPRTDYIEARAHTHGTSNYMCIARVGTLCMYASLKAFTAIVNLQHRDAASAVEVATMLAINRQPPCWNFSEFFFFNFFVSNPQA